MATNDVLADVRIERANQDAKWGEQNHPDGTGDPLAVSDAVYWRHRCDEKHRSGDGTYRDILQEEVSEAFAEADPERLRNELIQVAAVACAWVEAIDRRQSTDR